MALFCKSLNWLDKLSFLACNAGNRHLRPRQTLQTIVLNTGYDFYITDSAQYHLVAVVLTSLARSLYDTHAHILRMIHYHWALHDIYNMSLRPYFVWCCVDIRINERTNRMMVSRIDICYFSTRVKSFEIDGYRIVAEKKIKFKIWKRAQQLPQWHGVALLEPVRRAEFSSYQSSINWFKTVIHWSALKKIYGSNQNILPSQECPIKSEKLQSDLIGPLDAWNMLKKTC